MLNNSTTLRHRSIVAILAPLVCGPIAFADETVEFEIPAQPAATGLNLYADQAAMQILFPYAAVEDVETNEVVGELDKDIALDTLLADTGLEVVHGRNNTVTVRPIDVTEDNKTPGKSQPASSQVLMAQNPTSAQQDQARSNSETSKTEDEDTKPIEEIVVTAAKREQTLSEAAIGGITALSGDDLLRDAVSTIEDIQFQVPGVQVGDRLGSGVVTIRGVGFDFLQNGVVSSVAIHQDSMYMARPAGALASFFDVERIEVVRGPQGTLYGRNSTAGAVNIISRKPTETLSGYLKGTAGSYDRLDVEGAVSNSLIPGLLKGRLAFKTENRSGFGDNLTTLQDINDRKRNILRGILEVTPSEDLQIELIGNYFNQDDSGATQHFNGAGGFIPPLGLTLGGTAARDIRDVRNDTQPADEKDIWSVIMNVSWNITRSLTLESITGHQRTDTFFLFDLDQTDFFILPNSREEDAEQFTQELRLSGSVWGIDWLVGGFAFIEDNTVTAQAPFGVNDEIPFPFDSILQRADIETDAFAGFGELRYAVTDEFTLTFGARVSTEEVAIDELADLPPILNNIRQEKDTDFTDFTPKFLIEYSPTAVPGIKIFAAYEQGIKSGGFNPGALDPPFGPEEISAFHGGINYSGQRIQGRFNGFLYDYKDLQVSKVGVTTVEIENAAEATVAGLELEFTALLMDQLRLQFAGSYLDATFDEFDSFNSAFPMKGELDLSGNQLPSAPEFTMNIGLEYSYPVYDGILTVRPQVYWQDDVYFTTFNERPNNQESFARADVTINWASNDGRWSFTAFGKNLEDSDHLSAAFTAAPFVGFVSQASLLPPRTWGVSLAHHFGDR